MAGDSVIGALRVVLGADTASLDKGLKSSQSSLADFGKAVAAIASGIELSKGIEKAVDALVHGIKAGIEQADKFNKLSQSIGIPVEELSKLNYAANLSDVSLESLGKAATKLSKNMVTVAGGGIGPAKQAFDALGISVKNNDGTLKSSGDVISEVADKFAGYKDGAAKTALAVALFGKAGADMIPLLNQGKDGLKQAGDEAEQFGLVLDKKTTQAAEEFNDNLTRLKKIFEGIVVQITANMLPALEEFSAQMVDLAKNGGALQAVSQGIVDIFRRIDAEAVAAKVNFERLGATMGAVWNLITSFASGPAAFGKAWDDLSGTIVTNKKAFDDLKVTMSNILTGVPQPPDWTNQTSQIKEMNKSVIETGKAWTQTAAPIIQSANAQRNAVQGFLDSQAKRTASQLAEVATVGKSVGEQAKLRIEYEAQALALAKGIPLTDALRAKIAAAGTAAADAAMKLQGAQLIEKTGTPWDQRAQQVQQYTAAMVAAGASTQQLALMNMQVQFPNFTAASNAALDFGANVDKLATDSLNGLSSALTDVIMGTKSAGEAFKAFALQVIAELVQMIVKAILLKVIMAALGFAGGGPVGVVGAAGDMAVPTFAGGGGPVKGPGSSTSDSITARLSNGEFVVNADATAKNLELLKAINSGSTPILSTAMPMAAVNNGRASNDNTMPSGPATSSELTVRGIDPKALYTGDVVRSLAAQLIQFQKDGGKVVLAA